MLGNLSELSYIIDILMNVSANLHLQRSTY